MSDGTESAAIGSKPVDWFEVASDDDFARALDGLDALAARDPFLTYRGWELLHSVIARDANLGSETADLAVALYAQGPLLIMAAQQLRDMKRGEHGG